MTATTLVRSVSAARISSTDSSPVSRSNPTHRTSAPTASAACTHGRMLESWSSRVTTTLSPGTHCLASARDMSYVACVADRANTTPPASHPSRSATAARAPTTTSSARRSDAVTAPRLERPPVIVAAIASPTCRGDLAATRPVEVRRAVRPCREVFADAIYVEGHDDIMTRRR